MYTVIGKIRNEPLVHFIVAGAVLFLADHFWLSTFETDKSNREIVISLADQRRLTVVWQLQWGRRPTEDELGKILDSEIREQVLYREALNLGLETGDTVIRRRLVQKLQYLNEDVATLIEPTEQELADYYDLNAQSYKVPVKVSFSHIFFNPDIEGNANARAQEVLAQLQADGSGPQRAPERGDSLPIKADWISIRIDELERVFGGPFAAAMIELPLGAWQGPISSGLGVHLVHLTARQESLQPEMRDVRDAVMRDYMYARKLSAADRAYDEIRSRYLIRIESAAR